MSFTRILRNLIINGEKPLPSTFQKWCWKAFRVNCSDSFVSVLLWLF
jgi:hypothetical protein